jgi:hypothetical protein
MKNIIALVIPCATIMNSAPFTAASVIIAAPSTTNPMCETEEYATSFLKSVWLIAHSAP